MAQGNQNNNNISVHARWLIAFSIIAITLLASISIIGERSCIEVRNIANEVIDREPLIDKQARIQQRLAKILIKARQGETAVARGGDPHTNDEILNAEEVVKLKIILHQLRHVIKNTTSPESVSCPLTGEG